jgi:xylose isomerase
MRSYLILKDKVARWNTDPEIQDIVRTLAQLGTSGDDGLASGSGGLKYSAATARALKERSFDLALLRRQGYQYERLDQLTTEVLLGVR